MLGRSYGPKIAAGLIADDRFVLRRLLRIWPAHAIMLAAFALVIAGAELAGLPSQHGNGFLWRNLPAQMLLIQAWGFNRGDGWNVPTWSLSALLICYAAFPSLWRVLRRAAGGAVLFIGGLSAVWITDILLRRFAGGAIYDLTFHLGVLRALPLFTLGLCMARAGEQAWPGRRWAPYVATAAGAAVIVLQFGGRFDLASVALLAVLIGGAGQCDFAAGARLARRLGDLSFPLYITHLFTGLIWFNAVRILVQRLHLGPGEQWALWGMALPLAIVAALAFEALVDQPMQSLINSGLRRRKPARPSLAPSPGR